MARFILKNMKKAHIVIFLAFNLNLLQAQSLTNELYPLTQVYHQFGLSAVQLIDPYLSILEYTGVGMRFEYSASRYLNPEITDFSSYSRVSGLAALTVNPGSTASISYMGGNAAWGIQYHYREIDNFVLLAGGNMDVDFAYKMNSRNVNNPVNIDLSTNLNAMLGARYVYPTRRRMLQFNAAIEFPIIGCMFVPFPGLSYYEMSQSNDFAEAIHFTSFHNKQGIKQNYSIDVPFNRSTWSFGTRMQELKYIADDQIYSLMEYSLFVGITYDQIRFSGRRVKVPDFFISPRY